MKPVKKKPAPKSSTQRSQTRTAKDNAWAAKVSGGKYKTLRTLMTAVHADKITLTEMLQR